MTGCASVLLLAALMLGCGGAPFRGDLGDEPLRQCMQTLPRLTVEGNELLIRCAQKSLPTRLKGLNRSGLQHKSSLQLAGFGSDPATELSAWREQWNAVVIRLPIAQNYYLNDDRYRQDIATLVATTKALGMYLILELHGYDATRLNEAQPDLNTTPQFWGQVAARFFQESHVLFDIWNEPHDVSWSAWKKNAEVVISAIRAAGALDTLVIVGGLEYAYDLSPLLESANRLTGLGPILYAAHPYPKSIPPVMAPEWDNKFGTVAQFVPIIISEYGVDDSGMVPYGLPSKDAAQKWLAELHDYIDAHHFSALAWSGGDVPQLTYGQAGGAVSLPSNPPNPEKPTDPFGIDVKAWMRKPIL